MLPADARRLRVDDPALAATLAHAGAELVEEEPDVEIVRDAAAVRGDAPAAIVTVSAREREGGRRSARALRRVGSAAAVRVRAELAARALRRRYAHVAVVPWHLEERLGRPGVRPPRGLAPAERLTRNAAVLARRAPGPTLFDAALADAALAAGAPLAADWPLLRAGAAVAPAPAGVLRLAVGPGARELSGQQRALEELAAAGPPEDLAAVVPWLLAHGRTGLAAWTVERTLPGARAPGLDGRLGEQCVAFLIALHHTGGAAPAWSAAAAAAALGEVLGPARRAAVGELGEAVDEALAGVPRGFVHGDFWTGNLLVDAAGRLTGVIDWEAAGDGRLPVVDLLHLRLSAERPPSPETWGPALLRLLLPWADGAPHALTDAYLAALGLDPSRAERRALVAAYWLEHMTHQLVYLDRDDRPAWQRANVDGVLAELVPLLAGGPSAAAAPAPAEADADAWRALAEESGSVFRTPEWIDVARRHAAPGEEVLVRSLPGAVVTLAVRRQGPLRVAGFPGGGLADDAPVAHRPETAPAAAAALLELAAEARARVLLLEHVPGGGALAAALGGRTVSSEASPTLRIESSWDDYLAAQSRNFREQVRRRERKLAREHELAYRLCDDPARLDEDLDTLFALHRARWGAGTAFAQPAAEAFHRDFARVAFERGWLRLWLLDLDGVTRAAWYGFRFGGADSYYQAGRDPDWEAASVGFVLLSHTIRDAFESGAREYRFLRGGEAYKSRFTDDEATVETLLVGRGALASTAAAVAARAATDPRARRVVRRLRG